MFSNQDALTNEDKHWLAGQGFLDLHFANFLTIKILVTNKTSANQFFFLKAVVNFLAWLVGIKPNIPSFPETTDTPGRSITFSFAGSKARN